MTTKDGAPQGGLDLEATCERVFQAWTKGHGDTHPSAWLLARWEADGDGTEWTALDPERRRDATRGSREIALAVVLERLYRFCDLELPLGEAARRVRVARTRLHALTEAVRDLGPEFTTGLADYGLEQISRSIEAFAWMVEQSPIAKRELDGGRGRRPSDLRDELVVILAHGGYRVAEIASLIVDPSGRKGAETRIRQALHARRAGSAREIGA